MKKQTKSMYELNNMTLDEMKDFFLGIGEKPFRASQVFRWMYKGDVEGQVDFDSMTNIPKELRSKLHEIALVHTLNIEDVKTSAIDGSRKFLLRTIDGHFIESVFMKYESWNSICVSSQAGCRMKCAFCASGASGFRRNLNAGEMIDQVTLTAQYTGETVNHVVIMGVGEPLDNFEQTERFVRILEEPEGLHIGRRNITISTCGLIPGIKKLAGALPQVNLAVSLHAPDNELRSGLMPINDRYKIPELLKAVREHISQTGRKATIEYALIKGVNDDQACAKRLASILKGMNCYVNLISLNETDMGFSGSNRREAELFKKTLEDTGVQAVMRRSLGRDILGACGQLRLMSER